MAFLHRRGTATPARLVAGDADRRRLEALKTDCGCAATALAVLTAMAVYGCYFFYADADAYGTKDEIIAACALFFASALLGKALGMLLAGLRYRILEKKLAAKP